MTERPPRWVRRQPRCRRMPLLLRICVELRRRPGSLSAKREISNMFAWLREPSVGEVEYWPAILISYQRSGGMREATHMQQALLNQLAVCDSGWPPLRLLPPCHTITSPQTHAAFPVSHLVSKSISVALVAAAAFTTCGVADRPGSVRTISSDAWNGPVPRVVCCLCLPHRVGGRGDKTPPGGSATFFLYGVYVFVFC